MINNMGYFYDGGVTPGTEGTSTPNIGLTNADMASNKEINSEMSDAMWSVMNENTQLKQENYMLKAQLEQIKRIISGWK